jgi:hypothetical protein
MIFSNFDFYIFKFFSVLKKMFSINRMWQIKVVPEIFLQIKTLIHVKSMFKYKLYNLYDNYWKQI